MHFENEVEFKKLRQKLVMYFSGRRLSPAEDYADEVIFRAVSKISEGEVVEDLRKYVFGIAKFVCLEAFKNPTTVSIDSSGAIRNGSDEDDSGHLVPDQLVEAPPELEETPEEINCLRGCLKELPEDKRNLLVSFYRIKGTDKTHIEQRKKLAGDNGMSAGTLYTNICRLRKKVGTCVENCLGEKNGDRM
ncbi:MAG: hypothetical protein IPM63_14300 [Acidobacteriota bacterium]|nr:MAG: hypothetical protein IPM63_14300 [Acidobacteriota bacterium]